MLPAITMRVCSVAQSCLTFFVTPWTVAHQAPLSMVFSRQEHWNGLPYPSPWDLADPWIELSFLRLLHCRRFFTHWAIFCTRWSSKSQGATLYTFVSHLCCSTTQADWWVLFSCFIQRPRHLPFCSPTFSSVLRILFIHSVDERREQGSSVGGFMGGTYVLVRVSREVELVGCVCVCVCVWVCVWVCVCGKRFIIRNWLLRLWRLTSPKICSQQARNPREPMV